MTEKLDEQDLRRVSMVWPADLKERVRGLVGSRGLTDFTLDAVREKLRRLAGTPEPERPPEQPTQDPTPGPAPVPTPTPPAAAPREPGTVPAGQCPSCGEDLVNGECWTCPAD